MRIRVALGVSAVISIVLGGCSPGWGERIEQRVPERARGAHLSYDVAGLFDDEPLKQSYKSDAVGPIYEPGPDHFARPRPPMDITREPVEGATTAPSAPTLP